MAVQVSMTVLQTLKFQGLKLRPKLSMKIVCTIIAGLCVKGAFSKNVKHENSDSPMHLVRILVQISECSDTKQIHYVLLTGDSSRSDRTMAHYSWSLSLILFLKNVPHVFHVIQFVLNFKIWENINVLFAQKRL